MKDNYKKAIFIAPDADLIGDVTLEEDASIWFHAVLRGDHDSIRVGKGSNIQDGCILHSDAGFPVQIGQYVTIGHGAIIHGCEISDGALVGMGAIVLNGAKIGKDCMVAAGALVPQNMVIPDGMLVMGSPAEVRRKVKPEERDANFKNALEYIQLGKEYKNGKR